MKTIACTIAAVFFVLAILTFVPYPAARTEAQSVGFDPTDIEEGLQYAFERRLFMWGGVALSLGLLCVMVLVARRWADCVLAWTGGRRLLAALVMGLTYLIVQELLFLPISIGRYNHAVAWGMSNQNFPSWLGDHAIFFGLTLVSWLIVIAGLDALLIVLPRTWWLIAPIGMSLLTIAFVWAMPIVISPLFNDFTPLSQTKWKDQQPRVQALIDKAGIPVQEILVVNGSRQSKHANAYFAGFGSTRRIVLFDTLMKDHTPDEVESVLAHEIGHWQHDHIVKGIVLGTLASFVACFLLHCILLAARGRAPWRLQSIADPAGLPLILLLAYLGEWATMPAQNAVMRYFERQADQTSLELADQPDAFAAGEKKMAKENKSNVAPTPWNSWLFNTHPTSVERIHMAEDWKKRKAPHN